MQGSSSHVQRVCADYEARAARVPRQKPPDVGIVFYNTGIHKTQVGSERLYRHWIMGKLRSDVHVAVLMHNADIIALSELGGLEEGFGTYAYDLENQYLCCKARGIPSCGGHVA